MAYQFIARGGPSLRHLIAQGCRGETGQGWLYLQGWAPSFVDDEEVVATMAAALSLRWRQQEQTVDGSKSKGGGKKRTQ
jgi:hypothetical protein